MVIFHCYVNSPEVNYDDDQWSLSIDYEHSQVGHRWRFAANFRHVLVVVLSNRLVSLSTIETGKGLVEMSGWDEEHIFIYFWDGFQSPCFFPICNVRVFRFYQSSGSLGSQLRAPDLSGFQISVATAGPQPDARANVRIYARKHVRMDAR